jgi:PPK2 family polyphosphate:nucleotide phosphotransferase
MAKAVTFKPGAKIDLDDIDPDDTSGLQKGPDVENLMVEQLTRLYELQGKFRADAKHALLIVLQGLDASGKDGTIRHVFSGVNPQGCEVDSFKAPTEKELAHDYLWRIHPECPRKGLIEIFNRSHYEDVLVVRVDELLPEKVWRKRYRHICEFERMLADCDTVILKFYLHISRKEQKRRMMARLEDPEKNWKFSEADLRVRVKWNAYREAYNEALTRTNTDYAPWHIVPADAKWHRNLVVARTVVNALEKLRPKFPKSRIDLTKVQVK